MRTSLHCSSFLQGCPTADTVVLACSCLGCSHSCSVDILMLCQAFSSVAARSCALSGIPGRHCIARTCPLAVAVDEAVHLVLCHTCVIAKQRDTGHRHTCTESKTCCRQLYARSLASVAAPEAAPPYLLGPLFFAVQSMHVHPRCTTQ